MKHLRLALTFAASLLVPQIVTGQTFGYFGPNGPAFWGTLSPDWVACGTGTIQSPVAFGKVTPHHPRLPLTR